MKPPVKRGIPGMRTMHKSMTRTVLALLFVGVGVMRADAQDWRTVTMSRQVEDEQSVDVEVRYGAGTFIVGAAEAGTLYRMQLKYDEEVFEPVAEHRGSDLRIGTETIGHRWLGRDHSGGEMELAARSGRRDGPEHEIRRREGRNRSRWPTSH